MSTHLILLLVSSGHGGQVDMAVSYALRADSNEHLSGNLVAWLTAVATCFFVVKEFGGANGENPHVHCYFESDKKLDALRKDFKRKFPGNAGNGGYSLKECDDDVEAYGRYMCKGPDKETLPDVVARQGLRYTDEWVRDMHDQYWVNNAALMTNKRKRAAQGNAVERLELECKEKGIRWDDRKAIALEFVRLYKASARPINTFFARQVVNTVSCLLDPSGDAEERLATEIADRY